MDKIIAITRNWRGINEINYLMNPEDFKKFIECEDDVAFENIMELLKEGPVEHSFWANDTISAYLVNDDKEIKAFLEGKNNDDISEVFFNNYDKELSPLENYLEYSDWYYHFDKENSSEEIVDYIRSKPELAFHLNEIAGFLPDYLEMISKALDCLEADDEAYVIAEEEIKTLTLLKEYADQLSDPQLIEVCDKIALFIDGRVDRSSLPEGLYCYDFREGDGDDDFNFATLEPIVKVNHGGSAIFATPIDFGTEGFISFDEDSSPNFLEFNL
jgi:hypothetical protein